MCKHSFELLVINVRFSVECSDQKLVVVDLIVAKNVDLGYDFVNFFIRDVNAALSGGKTELFSVDETCFVLVEGLELVSERIHMSLVRHFKHCVE